MDARREGAEAEPDDGLLEPIARGGQDALFGARATLGIVSAPA